MREKIVILGATGFVGKAVCSLFLKRVAGVELYSKKGGDIDGHPVQAIDISKEGRLWQQLKGKKVQALIYLSSKNPVSFRKADRRLFSHNVSMHNQVLECWERAKCHLIYASSCSVYGNAGVRLWREENAVFPDNLYSLSKLVGELLFCERARNKNLPLTVLRLNAPFGVKTRNKTVVNIFIEQALKGKDLVLFGSGKREQDFMFVEDMAEAFWSASKKRKYGIFNIATGSSITMKKLADMIIRLTRSSSGIIYSDKPDPQGEVKVSIDIAKAKRELAFLPAYSLEDGLEECILKAQETKV